MFYKLAKHSGWEVTSHAQTLKVTPSAKFGVLARLSRAPKRSVLCYVSIGAQRKRSQNPKSADVAAAKDTGDGLRAEMPLSPRETTSTFERPTQRRTSCRPARDEGPPSTAPRSPQTNSSHSGAAELEERRRVRSQSKMRSQATSACELQGNLGDDPCEIACRGYRVELPPLRERLGDDAELLLLDVLARDGPPW